MMIMLASRVRFTRALKSRPFALLWMGQTVSNLGDAAFYTAMAWQILILTGSATAMGIVLTAGMVPRLVFLLIGGVTADRLPRRLVMFWSDSGRALIVLLIAILGWVHLLQFWHLVFLSLLFGIVDGFFIPAYQSIPPQLVETEDLPSANALNELSGHLSFLIGPMIGAGFVALVGSASAFAFDGLTFIVSALCLFVMRLPAMSTTQSTESPARPIVAGEGDPVIAGTATTNKRKKGFWGVIEDVREGLTYVTGSTWIWVTIVVASVGNIAFVAPLGVAMPKLVHDVYGAGVWVLGVITTASAIGSIIAILAVGQMRHMHRRGMWAYLSLIVSGLALIVFGLPLPKGSEPVVASIANVFVGFGLGFFNVIWFTVLQELVPGDKLGRVSSIEMLGSFSLLPVAYALGGILTDRLGPSWVFIVGGLINVALPLIALSVRGVRELE